jgi:precorrin-6A/cobalt-precorrin-6A reductase
VTGTRVATRILILGGTGEAAALAKRLAGDPRYSVETSLAGRTAKPAKLAGEVRMGGFGGAAGLADHIRATGAAVLVDATHPFAAQIRANAAEAARLAGVPLLRLERPAWTKRRGDRWHEVDSLAEAAKLAPKLGARAFLTVGRKEIVAFAKLPDVHFLVRLVEPPPAPLPLANHQLLLERGPFDEADELQLLRLHKIDLVIAKNSGGEATYGKIAAARDLRIPVILQRRPAPPPGYAPAATVETPEAAFAWIEAQR